MSNPETPRVVDDDICEISAMLDGKQIRSWIYVDDSQRRLQMGKAREFVEGWHAARTADPAPSRPDYAEAFGLPGGPAFPISIPGSGDNGAHGMSLRDWFAGRAMTAALGGSFYGTGDYINRIARKSYEIADAMLAARGERP